MNKKYLLVVAKTLVTICSNDEESANVSTVSLELALRACSYAASDNDERA